MTVKWIKEWRKWLPWTMLMIMLVLMGICNEANRSPQLGQLVELTSTNLEDMQRFRINGIESSNDWIEVSDDGQISILGFVGGIGGTLHHDSGLESASMFIPETVEGITMYHVIPFFRSVDTVQIAASYEDSRDKIEASTLLIVESDPSIYGLVQLDGTVRGDWIHADSITEYRGLGYQFIYEIQPLWRDNPGSRIIRRDFREADYEGQFWLDASGGEMSSLFGSSNSQKTYMRVPARLGSATIYHFVRVRGLDRIDIEPGTNSTIYVTVIDGELWASHVP